MAQLPAVKVSRRGAERIAAGHLWIYASDVTDQGEAQPGDAVKVTGPRGRALGTAHYSSTSQICLRMLSAEVEPIDGAFFLNRFRAALEHRQRIVSGTEAYRLVHAEGDLLPALIVDRYGDYLVVQTLDQGMDRAKADIIAALTELLAPAGIVERNDATVRVKLPAGFELDQVALVVAEVEKQRQVAMVWISQATFLTKRFYHYNGA